METNYLTGFYFTLVPLPAGNGQPVDAGFKEISGLNMTSNVEEVTSGGENRFKYRLPQPVSFPNLELKRGVTLANSPLLGWVRATLQNGFSQPISTQDMLLILLDANGQPNMAWQIVGAYPVKWSGGDFNADKSEVFIESIELAYQYYESNSQLLETAKTALQAQAGQNAQGVA